MAHLAEMLAGSWLHMVAAGDFGVEWGGQRVRTELGKGRGHPIWAGDHEEAGELLGR